MYLLYQLTEKEIKKEAFLHSLTPQLERWRARVNAITEVLQEYQKMEAERAAGEADGVGKASVCVTT